MVSLKVCLSQQCHKKFFCLSSVIKSVSASAVSQKVCRTQWCHKKFSDTASLKSNQLKKPRDGEERHRFLFLTIFAISFRNVVYVRGKG